MIDAGQDILSFTEGIDYPYFAGNKMTRFAVERQLLVIGEAAYHISDQCRTTHPTIPWKQIMGLRNIIAHDYGEILAEKIWLVATQHIAPLLDQLRLMGL